MVPETPKAPRKSGGLGRAATEVGDPVEVAEIKAAYKGNGGTLSFKQIEAEPRFNLRAAHGSTAYRIIKR